MRRRSSTRSSSGTSTRKGRTSPRAMEVSAWVMVVSFRGRRVVVTALAEGEGVGLDTGIREGDLEGALGDGAGLADQLVQPRVGDHAMALVVEVGAVGGARGLVVDPHLEPYRRPPCRRGHDQVQVAGVEAGGDPPLGLVEHDGLPLYRPVT